MRKTIIIALFALVAMVAGADNAARLVQDR